MLPTISGSGHDAAQLLRHPVLRGLRQAYRLASADASQSEPRLDATAVMDAVSPMIRRMPIENRTPLVELDRGYSRAIAKIRSRQAVVDSTRAELIRLTKARGAPGPPKSVVLLFRGLFRAFPPRRTARDGDDLSLPPLVFDPGLRVVHIRDPCPVG